MALLPTLIIFSIWFFLHESIIFDKIINAIRSSLYPIACLSFALIQTQDPDKYVCYVTHIA